MSCFVVIFEGVSDSSAQEERSLESALKLVKVVDRLPGTVLVEGEGADAESALRQVSNCVFTSARRADVAPSPPDQAGSRLMHGLGTAMSSRASTLLIPKTSLLCAEAVSWRSACR